MFQDIGIDRKENRKNLCKCLACGKKFEFKDAFQKPTFSTFRPACPHCKSERLETLRLANSGDNMYMNSLSKRV